MIGGIVAIVIAYGFYRAAETRGLPNFQWAVAGTLAYYLPNFIWSLAVAKPWVNSLHAANNAGMAGIANLSSVLIGLAVALVVYKFLLPRAPLAQ
ncbi:hypothetical protein SAMN02949497_2450 [Methylomagnum ishizawai]|uniref:Uncharacterized protein n=1 Tax=Methylomagnum ishizawai TaxID=1760988 RepID=A0A1Y6D3Y7_9GAMM|nr:hypothetical protein [Methylomagnum ishizawai]SMF95104.1 hypothetical protein SAMN02949497_2450 [Methylomagnum ishizawai]